MHMASEVRSAIDPGAGRQVTVLRSEFRKTVY
jgi:hypothetical protein